MEGVWYECVTGQVCAKRMKIALWAHEGATAEGQSGGQANR